MKTSILIINKLAPVCLYHLKRLQCLHNCLFLLLRAPWLSSILRLWQIEILSQFNTTFPFYLSNIEIRNLHPIIMFCNILFYLFIGCLGLSRSSFQFGNINIHINIIIRLLTELGKKNNRLHMCRYYYRNTFYQPRCCHVNTIRQSYVVLLHFFFVV